MPKSKKVIEKPHFVSFCLSTHWRGTLMVDNAKAWIEYCYSLGMTREYIAMVCGVSNAGVSGWARNGRGELVHMVPLFNKLDVAKGDYRYHLSQGELAGVLYDLSDEDLFGELKRRARVREQQLGKLRKSLK